jgi:hypothetical protein
LGTNFAAALLYSSLRIAPPRNAPQFHQAITEFPEARSDAALGTSSAAPPRAAALRFSPQLNAISLTPIRKTQ